MNAIVHKSESRGSADHGWLKARHTFSFANYHDPERMGFGALRVLNDDIVAPSMGFSTHPHQNMEIVTVPLVGALQHKDSVGNESVIRHGEVQLMSAGKGVRHSEFNASQQEPVNLLQIWVLPEKLNIDPRYEQKRFNAEGRANAWQLVVSPMDKSLEGVKINQDAYFSLGDLEAQRTLVYTPYQAQNLLYLFVIDGDVMVESQALKRRDAIGLSDFTSIEIKAQTNSQLLAIEIPH